MPVAPGTFGSILGIVLHLAWLQVTDRPGPTLLAMAFAVVLAIGFSDRVERELDAHDPGEIVIDEVVGMWIALWQVTPTLPNLVLAFGLFRVLDVVKIWPANRIDRRLRGGAGVVLDDVVSGVYANLLLRLLL